MADLGNTAQAVNAKQMQIFIGSVSNEWKLIQNARVMISHPIFREPTTAGGVVTYTGAPDHSISGSLLFTRDEWNDGSANDISSLITIANGEAPANSWLVKFTDVSGAATNATLTFANCKLSVVDISKSAEGAVKADITVVCPDEPATS
tara:strand:- start:18722 stop:19168 length:447 start_codon:yes stop_codon:yes gene_type:complete